MRTYKYRARDTAGRIVEGTVRAGDGNEAQQLIEADGLIPVEIHLAAEKKGGQAPGFLKGKVKPQDVMIFTRQLSTMMKAGMPIAQALQVLRGQTENPTLKKALEDVSNSISGGSRLSEALAQFPHIFSSQYVNIVVSGESGGGLVESLLNMAEWMERELEIRTDIKTALRYPLMVVVALVLAGVFTLVFIIPRFAAFFAKSTIPLPLPTRMLIAGNNLLQHHWPMVIGVIIVSGVIIFFLLKRPLIRLNVDKLKFRLPIAGPLYKKIVISRFSRIFSMLVRNGVPVVKALEISPTVVTNAYFRESTEDAKQSIQGGGSIFEGFSHISVFPPMVSSLVAIGEKTGALGDMLDLVVAQYDMDIKYALKNLTTMIEPIITAVMGVAVLFLTLSIFLPIWNMSQVLRQ